MADVDIPTEVAGIEEQVNLHLGGEAAIGDIVALMLERGWTPPQVDEAWVSGPAEGREAV